MADTIYLIRDTPDYGTEIRALQNTDPANAETIFNPLFQRLIDNIHYLKLEADKHEQDTEIHRRLIVSETDIPISDRIPGGIYLKLTKLSDDNSGSLNIGRSITARDIETDQFYSPVRVKVID